MKHKNFTFKLFFLLVTLLSWGYTSQVNAQVWGVPCGTPLAGNNGYLTAATTTGEAVYYPLSYANNKGYSSYMQLISKNTTQLIRGKSFNLYLLAKQNGPESTTTYANDLRYTCCYIYTDWDRDGNFEPLYTIGSESGALTPKGNMEVLNIVKAVSVPADATLGKTHIRVRYTRAENPLTGGNADIDQGLMFDMVVQVMDQPVDDSSVAIVALPNDYSLGKVESLTTPAANGRYAKGATVTLKAIPATNDEKFESWTIGNQVVSTEATYTFAANESSSLIANFSSSIAPLELAEPMVSTAESPVWFQIMNAHTSDTRKERCISWDGTSLLADKPADGSTRFLWRLESTSGNLIKLISKKDGKAISTVTTSSSTMGDTPAEFKIVTSKSLSGTVTNGSYAIELNGSATTLLNAQDTSWKIVTYSAGVGTGSGWYFYRSVQPSTGIAGTGIQSVLVFISEGKLNLNGVQCGSRVKVYNASGQLLLNEKAENTEVSFNFKQPKGIFLVQTEGTNGTIMSYKTVNY